MLRPPPEMPSNYVLERYFREKPSWWLGFICAGWGVFMVLVSHTCDANALP